MSRGHPDFGQSAPLSGIPAVVSTGDIAANLGSPNTIDRRGHVIFYDDFEHGIIKWLTQKSASVTLSHATDDAYSSLGCFKGVVSSGVDQQFILEKRIPYIAETNFGLELLFKHEGLADWLEIRIAVYDGTNLYLPAVRMDIENGTFEYTDSANVQQTLKDYSGFLQDANTWYYMKMVFDVVNLEYKRARFGGDDFDLSGITVRETPSTTIPSFDIYIQCDMSDGNSGTSGMHIDNIIFTIDED